MALRHAIRGDRRRSRPDSLGFVPNARQDSQECLDRPRVECLAGFLFDERDRGINRHRLVIRARRRQGAEVVHEAQDAGAERDVLALEAARIAAAVPSLVMTENQRRDRIGKRHRRDDVGADLRVGLDLLELFRRERARLRENVVGYGELADVVEQRGRLHRLHLDLGHPELARDSRGVDLHAANVVLRRAVLGVDRARERFDRRQVKLGNLLDVPAFVVEPREQVQSTRAVPGTRPPGPAASWRWASMAAGSSRGSSRLTSSVRSAAR